MEEGRVERRSKDGSKEEGRVEGRTDRRKVDERIKGTSKEGSK